VAPVFVLVHSPLVGPLTWSWVADDLRQRGHQVALPSLVPAASSGSWEACVEAVVSHVPRDLEAVLVGHSGAGPLLPVIAEALSRLPSRHVFVDAALPPEGGDAPLVPAEFLDALRTLAHDGILPRWSEWFAAGTMEGLIPDRSRREAVLAELPRLPLSYFENRVPVPDQRRTPPGAYVLLSEPYRPAAEEAASRGWPVVEMLGAHLDIVVRPARVADALLSLA
jgi:hypothetical protein